LKAGREAFDRIRHAFPAPLCYAGVRTRPVSPGGAEKGDGSLRKVLIGEARCRRAQVRYYLLEEAGSSYGIQVETGEEAAAVPDLSPSRRRVRELAEALVRGAVTPVSLRDVVDDWLLE